MKKFTLLMTTLVASAPAWAQEAAASGFGNQALYAIGGGLILGLAALGGTLGQGKIGSSAMEGIARNPQAGKEMFTPMIISFALVESLVVLSWLMVFFFYGKM